MKPPDRPEVAFVLNTHGECRVINGALQAILRADEDTTRLRVLRPRGFTQRFRRQAQRLTTFEDGFRQWDFTHRPEFDVLYTDLDFVAAAATRVLEGFDNRDASYRNFVSGTGQISASHEIVAMVESLQLQQATL